MTSVYWGFLDNLKTVSYTHLIISFLQCGTMALTRPPHATTVFTSPISDLYLSIIPSSILAAPIIIIDLGTATKITVVDSEKSFRGGSIMPGVNIALEALSSKTAQLPSISLEGDVTLIGTNTVDCMRSGIVLGAASMLDGMIERYKSEMGEVNTVVACGGLVNAIVPHCKNEIIIDDNLLMDGLNVIYRKNKNQ